MALSPVVNLWVRSEPFIFGVFPVPPHPKLSLQNIKRIVNYAKNKGKSDYPKLSYSVWKHIACNKLQLPAELAWLYFTTFDLLSDISPEVRLHWDKKIARCSSSHDTELVKSQLSVPVLKFVLFLFIQHLQKINLRSSLVSFTEEWPREASPDLDGRSTPRGNKGLDEHSQRSFILNNLDDIMNLLLETDSYGGGDGGSDLCLSIEAVEALGFLIEGSVDGNRNIKPLQDIALMQQVHQKSGYSKISRSFSFRSLQTWLRSHLSINPFGVSSCIAQGRRLSWPLAGEDKESRADSKRGRIATNALFIPKDQIKGNKLIIMSQVCKQTVARMSGTLDNATLKIHRCHYSYIYLLSSMRAVTIEKCRNSTIVLGAVETVVHLNHCEHCIVITSCRRLSTTGSTHCTLHTLTPNRPLLFTGNESITLAPYHTYYAKLGEHLEKVGLGTEPNHWDYPLCVGSDHHDDLPVWKLMNPKDFYIFSIPFDIEGETKETPGGLPSRYQKALIQRERQIEQWQKMVKEAALSKDHRKQFQSIVESRFQEWLEETGHKRELDSLVVPIVSDTRSKRDSASPRPRY